MKVIGIAGSPRTGGNSDIMVQTALESAAAQGADTQLFRVNDLQIRGCQACMYCRTHDGCAVQDDMQSLFSAITGADAVVLGAPVYMGQVSAQMWLVINRLYRFLSPDFSARVQKPALLLVSQGNPNADAFADAVKKTRFVGLQIQDVVIAAGTNEPDAVRRRPDLLARVRTAMDQVLATASRKGN